MVYLFIKFQFPGKQLLTIKKALPNWASFSFSSCISISSIIILTASDYPFPPQSLWGMRWAGPSTEINRHDTMASRSRLCDTTYSDYELFLSLSVMTVIEAKCFKGLFMLIRLERRVVQRQTWWLPWLMAWGIFGVD